MARLPSPGGDSGKWGDILNDFLKQSLNADGSIKSTAVESAGGAVDTEVIHNTGNETVDGVKTFSSSPIVPTPTNGTDATNKSYVDSAAASGTPDADATTKGKVQLAGDLSGTAASPTVPGLANKAAKGANSDITSLSGLTTALSVPQGGTGANTLTGIVKGNGAGAMTTVTAPSGAIVGTTDSQTLTNKTLTAPVINSPTGLAKGDVGLGNVDNTSDATKNSAVATLTNKTLTAPVINSPTGLAKGDVGLGNVDNTSDATKNSAVATLTNKTLTAPVINSPTGIVKGDVGLGNVDNTSDATKNSAVATLTNKRVTKRVATLTDAATVTPDIDSYDGAKLTSLSQTTTIANPTGTPTSFQQFILRIRSISPQSLSFGSGYRGGNDIALPTTTTGGSKTDYFGFQYNLDDNKWDLIATARGY